MTKSLMSSFERARFGVTVSALVEGNVRTIVEFGPTQDALERAIERLEARGRIEQVLAISTPETIYRDLQGPRMNGRGFTPVPPEALLLTQIGRMDLSPEPLSKDAARLRTSRIRVEERRLAETGSRRPPRKKLKHGYNSYRNGCRCEICSAAGEAFNARRRKRR